MTLIRRIGLTFMLTLNVEVFPNDLAPPLEKDPARST